MARRGKAAVAVVTSEFEALAHTMAANAGRPGLRVLVLPYPLDSRPEEEVRQIARAHYRPLLRTLGVPG
ncbi:MAG TPA: hypothetical protein VKY15_01125 [Acidimicrobiales bacterium]|nr:hypothetical protein [Acidimicrobiales bacterium]